MGGLTLKQLSLKANCTMYFGKAWRHVPLNQRGLTISSLKYSSAVWDLFRQNDIDKLGKILVTRFVTQNYRQRASGTCLIQNLG